MTIARRIIKILCLHLSYCHVLAFEKELFEPDLDRLTDNLEAAMEFMPCFRDASIQSIIHGPITYTPDDLPMLGPTLLPNLWLAAGIS